MRFVQKQAALKAFYYLISVDGVISEEEMDCYRTIGKELDPEQFEGYCTEVVESCEAQLGSGIDPEDRYELVLEGIDQELLLKEEDPETGIPSRLLVWDMLVIAFSNQEYSAIERKVIKHIVRITGMDHDIFLEMEQTMKASVAVERELDCLKQSDRPYGEVAPIVEELEKRRKGMTESIKQLIEDEEYAPVEKINLPGAVLHEGVSKAKETIVSGTTAIGQKTAHATKSVAETLGSRAKKIFPVRKGKEAESTGVDHAQDPDKEE